MNRALTMSFAALLALPAVAGPAPAQEVHRDPEAVALAERTMRAMGGAEAWESARVLVFTFQVEREGEVLAEIHHAWDRGTGDYRIQGPNRTGGTFEILLDIETLEGRAWQDGTEVPADAFDDFARLAQGRFINDTYWLLMPWKWLDPGVNLVSLGEETLEGATWDVVELTFTDGTGLTSNDRYRGYVSRESGLMERWAYLLQDEEGNPGTGEFTHFLWKTWEDVGEGLILARDKEKVGGEQPVAIRYPVLEAHGEVPEGLFDPEVPFARWFE